MTSDALVEGVAADEGYFLDISLVWNAGRLCSPFSRGYATPSGMVNGGAA